MSISWRGVRSKAPETPGCARCSKASCRGRSGRVRENQEDQEVYWTRLYQIQGFQHESLMFSTILHWWTEGVPIQNPSRTLKEENSLSARVVVYGVYVYIHIYILYICDSNMIYCVYIQFGVTVARTVGHGPSHPVMLLLYHVTRGLKTPGNHFVCLYNHYLGETDPFHASHSPING